MDGEFIRKRITELRAQKGVSEYKMSLDMGHSKNYIRTITSGGALPSMQEFFYLCDYLGVRPRDFFDENSEVRYPQLTNQVLVGLNGLEEDDIQFLLEMVRKLKR